MKVVVTGASGLIGRTVADAFASDNVDVVAVVGSSPLSAGVTLDLRTPDSIQVIVDHEPDVIVHAAAVLPAGFFGDDAERAALENQAIDDVVLSAARTTGCHLIFLSGTSLYGCVQTMCTERSEIQPRGPYLEAKRQTEEKVADLPGVGTVLRVSSPYGAGQRFPTVLHKFLRQAARGQDLRFYGSGAREQDFVAVEDVATAVVAASRASRPGIFNVASGQPTTMKELAERAIQAVGTTRSHASPAGMDDPEEHCRARIDISLALSELQWHPAVDLAAGLRRLATAIARDDARDNQSSGRL